MAVSSVVSLKVVDFLFIQQLSTDASVESPFSADSTSLFSDSFSSFESACREQPRMCARV